MIPSLIHYSMIKHVVWYREMCDCVEAILVPSGDRIKDLVDEIFQV